LSPPEDPEREPELFRWLLSIDDELDDFPDSSEPVRFEEVQNEPHVD